MTTRKPMTPTSTSDGYEPLTPAERLEEDFAYATLAAGEALSAVEVVALVLLGLLVCPPLAILAVVVVVPLAVVALVVGLLAALLCAPYLLIQHLRSPDKRHVALLGERLRHAGRALLDVLPHRIVADVRHRADR